jgi:sugar phosphate isomerase/epimerase
MNLGIVADEIERDFGRALRVGTSLGLRRYEIRFLKSGRAPMCDPRELLEVEHQAREEGVEITALSPGLFKHVSDAAGFKQEMNELYPRVIEWAKRWKLSGLIVFGFEKPGATEENGDLVSSRNPPAEVLEWITQAGDRARTDGIQLMIEPEPVCWADTWTATSALIRRAGIPSLQINDDPGNVAWMERRDSVDEFKPIASLIANVHVKDLKWAAPGSGKPKFVPAGEGMIDYRYHFAVLQQASYQGPISLEPHMDGSVETIRRCKRAFEDLWNSATCG